MVKPLALKGYFIVVAVFALGAASGGAASYAYAQRRHAALLGDEGRDLLEGRRLHALSRRLDLDADQQERTRAILAKGREKLRGMSRDMLDRCGQPLRDYRAEVDAEIRGVLRPDQQKRYDQLSDERREHMWLGPSGPRGR